MTNDQTVTQAAQMPLAECPIGLFLCGRELCLKTEYGNNEGRIDAYIVSSGEFFWGDAPQTIASQRAQLVTPVDADDLLARHRTVHSGEGRSNGAGEENQLLADANSHYSSVQIEEITARHRKLARDHTAPDDGVGRNLYGDTARMLAALSAPQGEVEREAFRPMSEWDRRDETVMLLVDYSDGAHPLDDATVAITIGHNNDHNIGPDEADGWKFAGWCWSHDHYVEGKGTPIGWMPLPHHLAALAQPEAGGEHE